MIFFRGVVGLYPKSILFHQHLHPPFRTRLCGKCSNLVCVRMCVYMACAHAYVCVWRGRGKKEEEGGSPMKRNTTVRYDNLRRLVRGERGERENVVCVCVCVCVWVIVCVGWGVGGCCVCWGSGGGVRSHLTVAAGQHVTGITCSTEERLGRTVLQRHVSHRD